MAHNDNSAPAFGLMQFYREDFRGPFAFTRGQTVGWTV